MSSRMIFYINKHYGVHLKYEDQSCEFHDQNQQCIKETCPFLWLDMNGLFNKQNKKQVVFQR